MTTLGLPWHVPAPVAADEDSDDQHTPNWLLDLVAKLWPGGIDTDPAYSPESHVSAGVTYNGKSAEQDGLVGPWVGKVWCNPPYSNPAPWADRIARHHATTGAEALMLVNVSTTVRWFRRVRPSDGKGSARAVAFFNKRIAFIKNGVERRGNDREQMMLWWGPSGRLKTFRRVFGGVAWIVT